jgi:hypothetical protein
VFHGYLIQFFGDLVLKWFAFVVTEKKPRGDREREQDCKKYFSFHHVTLLYTTTKEKGKKRGICPKANFSVQYFPCPGSSASVFLGF